MLMLVASLVLALPVSQADDHAFLAIQAETKLMRIPGMPVRKMPQLPPGIKLPGNFQMPGAPSRTLTVRLWSPSIAPDNAFAYLAPPSGLKQGDKMNLELYRPTPSSGSATSGTGSESDQHSNQDFTIKIYWGSSDTVKPDQPKIIKLSELTAEQKTEMMRREQEVHQSAANYFYKPNWTTGYWPTSSEPGRISDDASLVGSYALTTNYTGNVAIDVPPNVDFLAPIEMTSPSLDQKVSLDGSIPFQWSAIPNAIGQYATIMGMEGKNTLILWSSSEIYHEGIMANMGFPQMSEVKDLVAKNVYMAGDRTSVTVPAGIFKDASFAMFSMTGFGPGTALDNGQPIPRVQTKTTLSIMLGGSKSRVGGGGN
jgi:hypothetical protein